MSWLYAAGKPLLERVAQRAEQCGRRNWGHALPPLKGPKMPKWLSSRRSWLLQEAR